MAEFGITGIDRINFAVADVDMARRYASDWGLAEIDLPAEPYLFTTADGCEVEFSSSGAGSEGLVIVTWGVRDAACIDALEAEFSKDREVSRPPGVDGWIDTHDDLGFGLSFRVSQRRHVDFASTEYNQPGQARRVDQRGPRYTQARPHEISHLAIAVDDAGAASRFYIDRLGFTVSDRYADRGVFMRCSPSGNHHNLFLLNGVKPGTHFGHLAFKVRDAHEVVAGGQAFDAKGWTTFAGPGRHLVSSANFWYFLTPWGGSWEYAADEDMVTEEWEAVDWAAEAHIFSEWTFGLEKSDGRLRGPISQSKAVTDSTNV